MDAGGRRQLEKRPRDEEYIRLVYKFRENCPLLDLKDLSLVKRKSFCAVEMVSTACSKAAVSLGEEGKYTVSTVSTILGGPAPQSLATITAACC